MLKHKNILKSEPSSLKCQSKQEHPLNGSGPSQEGSGRGGVLKNSFAQASYRIYIKSTLTHAGSQDGGSL